jgi:hypothetical protein
MAINANDLSLRLDEALAIISKLEDESQNEDLEVLPPIPGESAEDKAKRILEAKQAHLQKKINKFKKMVLQVKIDLLNAVPGMTPAMGKIILDSVKNLVKEVVTSSILYPKNAELPTTFNARLRMHAFEETWGTAI